MKITLEIPDDTVGMAITALRHWTGTTLTMLTRQFYTDDFHEGAELKLLLTEEDDDQRTGD